MPLFGKDPRLPNYTRPEYYQVLPDLTLIDDELAGTRRMHEKSDQYIRKWKAELKANYDIRRKCETFFEGFGRTLSAAVGMLFAKPPVMTWNGAETAMTPHWYNIDAEGTAGVVFVKRFAEAAVRDGIAILLVDHPNVDPGVVVTEANELALNLRPRWASYSRANIVNWYAEIVNNERVLTQLTLYEPAVVRNAEFGVSVKHRFRDLRLVPAVEGEGEGRTTTYVAVWRLWEVIEAAADRPEHFREIGNGAFVNRHGEPARRLPVAVSYTGRTDGPMNGKIPLLGVAWANLSHWQLSTDLRFNSLVAGFAQPVVVGELQPDTVTGEKGRIEIGPLVTVQVQQGGDFKWAEPQGTGLERLKLLVQEKLKEIAQQGLSFLQTDTRAAETAEAKRLDATAENSTLATAAQGIEDAVNLALEIHAWYLGIEKAKAPVLTISRDYEETALAADIMTAYVKAISEAGLPVRILLQAWQQGGRIPSDVDLEELELEMMANEEARREAEAEAAAQRTQGAPGAE